MNRRLHPVRLLVAFAKAVFIAWTLMYFAEYFGWHLFREAGGGIVSARGLPETQSLASDRRPGLQDAPNLAGFGIGVKRTSDGIALTCERGCVWKTLTFGCADKKACTSKISDFGMMDDEKPARSGAFVFTVEGKSDGVALACERGCAWRTLTFGCGEKRTCESTINEYGMAKETK
jgi:hypothetical protein